MIYNGQAHLSPRWQIYHNFWPITRTADYLYWPIIAYSEKKSQPHIMLLNFLVAKTLHQGDTFQSLKSCLI